MTTRLFFVFYRTRRKFARLGATTSVIGKESYLMTSFSSTRRGTDSPLTEIGIKNKRQTRRNRAFITLIQSSVQPQFPYFSMAYIEIPQEVENLLSESH